MIKLTRSLVRKNESTRVSPPQVRRTIRHSLHDGFTTYSVLSPAIGLFVTVPAQREALSRVRASVEALRPHGFVVRAPAHSSHAPARVHRIPHPTFVTIAKRPSYRARDARRETIDLPDVTTETPATDWHDGQITSHGENAVKVKSSPRSG
ncbi:hypothetical protein [Bradyrhizobium sp.]|uniref:hypothetical protein n=1 Tax=Bradyrhizobium sp. TaxID=376 RepID=UPI002D52CFD9|nr:hypothetical protein [Bradyrhizobium sp.]HZR75969.1 hypothetical protein [Bradyrhizobium sp.]